MPVHKETTTMTTTTHLSVYKIVGKKNKHSRLTLNAQEEASSFYCVGAGFTHANEILEEDEKKIRTNNVLVSLKR